MGLPWAGSLALRNCRWKLLTGRGGAGDLVGMKFRQNLPPHGNRAMPAHTGSRLASLEIDNDRFTSPKP